MIKYSGNYELERATEGSAGFDLRANEDRELSRGKVGLIGTGVRVAIPDGHVGLLHIRSSLAKRGYQIQNSVGVIDSDYRGEVKVMLKNPHSKGTVSKGERIAQLVVVPFMGVAQRVDDLDETARGEGGFGSTGR